MSVVARRLLIFAFAGAALLFLARDRIEFELGYAYEYGDFHGLKFSPDLGKAARWLRLAAESGHARAQYLLGLSYSRGWGVRQDDAVALRWFGRSAEQAYPQACYHLAWMLHKGDGAPKDEARAQRLMSRAAESGMSKAVLVHANWLVTD